MRAWVIRRAMVLVIVLGLASSAAVGEEKKMAEDAVAVCTRHLQAIGRALDAYRRDRGALPENLSDLYPNYLTEKELFHCPADASPGTPGGGLPGDPRLPISYFYEMNTQRRPDTGTQLGPDRLGPEHTWREVRLAQRAYFGHRVPVVSCSHHEFSLILTETGEVYPQRGVIDWIYVPGTIAAALDRMEHDLTERPIRFTDIWAPARVQEYATVWIDWPLSPAIRHRLGAVAERLAATAKALPPGSRGDASILAARFYRAAGRPRQALAALEEVDRRAGDDAMVTFLRADLRYRLSGRKGRPPVDAYVKAEMASQHIPGLSLAVVRDGKVLLAKGYGLANVELGVPATPDTVYEIGTLSKQFTATGIMLLVEEGKISLDERVSRYLPDLPTAWSEVTIRHLLTHTSGIPNYGGGDYAKLRGQDVTPAEIIKTVSDRPLDFRPGERFAYSNTNYTLLGMTIERVSGRPYGEFMAERIFQPMGMTVTRLNDLRAVVPNRASGYSWENESLRHCEYWSASHFYSSGGIVSSVMDLVRWDALRSAGKLLKRSSWGQMWTPAVQATSGDGETISYGYGWNIGSEGGRKVIWHHGGKPGFTATLMRYPDESLTIVMLVNSDQFFGLQLPGMVKRYLLPKPRPIADKDGEITHRLKEVLVQLAEGHADPTQFTSDVQAALVLEIERGAAFYRSLGSLQSFRLIEQADSGRVRTYRYRAVFGESAWIHSFVLAPDGKIAELTVEPE